MTMRFLRAPSGAGSSEPYCKQEQRGLEENEIHTYNILRGEPVGKHRRTQWDALLQ